MTNLLIRLFVKNYKITKNPHVRENYGKFASITGIVSNLILFAIKIAAGLLFNSISITADAVNNLSDSGSSLVTLLGFKLSGKPADAKHPYGHARIEYISGLVVSFIIMFLGLQLLQSSVGKIFNPQKSQFSIVSVIILSISILIKLWQSMFYRKIARLIDSVTLMATSADSRNDIISTSAVLLAAVAGHLTGLDLDGYMGVVVALFILISGIGLVRDTINPLIGMAPTKEMVERIHEKILSYDHIIGLHDLIVHNYGANRCYASVHCEVDAEQDIMLSHDIMDNIERDFLKDEGIEMVIHLDPVVINDEKTNALKAKVEEQIREISPEISMHDFRVVWGISHTNLIFDIVVPFDFQWSDEEIVELVLEKITGIDSTYYPVITVDHGYIPDIG